MDGQECVGVKKSRSYGDREEEARTIVVSYRLEELWKLI